MRSPLLVLLLLAAAACAGARASRPVAAVQASAPAPALPFLADDYPRALAEARERGRPLFAFAWAPW